MQTAKLEARVASGSILTARNTARRRMAEKEPQKTAATRVPSS